MENTAEQAEQFSKLWMDFASRMATVGLAFEPGSPPPAAAREVRSALFGAMSESTDEFMRSEAFLQAMKQAMETSIAFRKQFNDFLVKMRHEAQAPANEDIDTLLLTMRHLETRLLERIDRLNDRLDEIATRLGANGNGHAEPADPEKPAARAKKGPRS